MNAWVVRLLVFLLVPVVLVAGPLGQSPASAETVAVGPTVKTTVTLKSGLKGIDSGYSCSLVGYRRVSDVGIDSVRATLRCKFGPFFDFNDGVKIDLYGDGGITSSGCHFNTVTSIVENLDNDVTVIPVNLQAPVPIDPTCVLTTVGLAFYEEDGNFSACTGVFDQGDSRYVENGQCYDSNLYRTAGWELGPRPIVKGAGLTCAHLDLSRIPYGHLVAGRYTSATVKPDGTSWGSAYANTWYWDLKTSNPTATWHSAWGAPLELRIVPVVRKGESGTPAPFLTSGSGDVGKAESPTPVNTPVPARFWRHQSASTTHTTRDLLVATEDYRANNNTGLVGMQIYVIRSASSGGAAFPATNDVYSPQLPQTTSTGDLGITDPSKCRWYVGDKIAELPNSTLDDPFAPMTGIEAGEGAPTGPTEPTTLPADEPEDPDQGECSGFSLTDPTSWAGAGICRMVQGLSALAGLLGKVITLLGKIVTAIGGLAASVVSGILDGLLSLLVPSDGYLESKVNSVKDSWSGTPPGEIVGTFSELPEAVGSPEANNCEGYVVGLDMPMTDQAVDLKPFQTCSGVGAVMAPIVRTGLRLAVYLGAFLVALRVLAASMGLQLSLGSGGKDDD